MACPGLDTRAREARVGLASAFFGLPAGWSPARGVVSFAVSRRTPAPACLVVGYPVFGKQIASWLGCRTSEVPTILAALRAGPPLEDDEEDPFR